jgi:Stage II sporulation protein/Carboxypeptidase regulatory-like domain
MVHSVKHRGFRTAATGVALGATVAILTAVQLPAASAGSSTGMTGFVRGQVVSELTGQPVAGAVVRMPDDRRQAITGPDGSFAFDQPLRTESPYRRLRAEVTAPGFGAWTIRGVPLYPNDALVLYAELRTEPFDHRVLTPEERGARPPSGGSPSSNYTYTCTGWDESLVPPPDIKVWITKDDKAKTYDFDFYADHVLPNEWIASWDDDALGAGAIAVKTYAWYRAQSGHAYSGGDGCADIVDTVADQVFDPTWSNEATDQAVYATLGSILRRDNEIFLSQYWSGAPDDPCAPVEGQYAGRMSQWGTQTCATKKDPILWPAITTTFYEDTKFFYKKNLLLNGSLQSTQMYPWLELSGTTATYTSGNGYNGKGYITFTPPDTGKNGTLYQLRPFLGESGYEYHEEVALRCDKANVTDCSVVLRRSAKPDGGTQWVKRHTVTLPDDGAWYFYEYDPPAPDIDHVEVEFAVISKFALGVDAANLTGPFGGR